MGKSPSIAFALLFALIAIVTVRATLLAGMVAHPKVTVVQSHALPDVPGKAMTSIIVDFPPGFTDRPHHHDGAVIVYVMSGTLRTAFGSTAPTILHAGQSFYEGPGMHHRIAGNASSTTPLRLFVTTVAPLTAPPAVYDMQH